MGFHTGKKKLGATYVSNECLPPRLASKLDSIFLYLLVNVDDKKEIKSNQLHFQTLIDELKVFEEKGMTINGEIIKFQLVQILGDNAGLNSILGFVENFNSDFSCRVCKLTKEKSGKFAVEVQSRLRSLINYEKDVEKSNVKLTGVKERCVFNDVPGFNVIENFLMDLMHDILVTSCMH